MAKLTKQELLNELQEQLGKVGIKVNKKETASVFNAFDATIKEAIFSAKEVGYDSFAIGAGTFKVVDVPERSGKSALDGKEWTTPPHQTVRFKLASNIKNELKARG